MIMYLKLTDWRSIGCQKPRKLIETCRSCFILCQAKMNQNIWIYCGQIYLILQCQTSEVHGFSKKSHKYIFHQIDNFCNYFFVKLISMKKIMQCLQQTCGNVPPNFHEKFLWFTLYRQRGSTSLIFCMSTFVRCLHKVEIIYPKLRGKKITMQRKYLCLIIPMWGLEL